MAVASDKLKILDRWRVADAAFGGFLYQACVGVVRWLDLEEDEFLFCEGDEDLDVRGMRGARASRSRLTRVISKSPIPGHHHPI